MAQHQILIVEGGGGAYLKRPGPYGPGGDDSRARWSMWWIERKLSPRPYWNRMLTGAQQERRFIPGLKDSGSKPHQNRWSDPNESRLWRQHLGSGFHTC